MNEQVSRFNSIDWRYTRSKGKREIQTEAFSKR